MDRLYRFSIPGITFFFSTWLFVYALTGQDLVVGWGKEWIGYALTLLLSTPIVGLILTTILHGFLHSISWKGRPGPYWYYLPKEMDDIVLSTFSPTGKTPITKKQWRQFYWSYQAFSRENLKGETIEFLTRRWTYCFVHFNNFWSLFVAVVVSVLLRIFYFKCVAFSPWLLLFAAVGCLQYVTFGRYISVIAMNDARNVEQRAIRNKLDDLK